MKKKVLSVLLVAAMAASMLAGCGSDSSDDSASSNNSGTESSGADENGSVAVDSSNTITIWVTELAVDLTKQQAEQFIADNGLDYEIVVEAVGEGTAATNMITDVSSGADIFGFAQDQLTRLVTAGAVQSLTDEETTWIQENNVASAASGAFVGDTAYAYPMTADNGYFMFYDSSVITDPTSLEQIIADCEAAGKYIYFDLDSAWYNAAFFFATGCTCEFETDDDGNFTSVTVDYASDAGVIALKEMIELASSSAFVDGSSVGDATNIGAIIDGNWDTGAAQTALGENYAAAELPSFIGADGETYHLMSFTGNKYIGVKPQEDATKLAVCYALARYLTDTDAQIARYEDEGLQWGPSNLSALESASSIALDALAAQNAYAVVQGNYPGDWWDLAGAIGGSVESGEISASLSDEDLLAYLQTHDDACQGYLDQ